MAGSSARPDPWLTVAKLLAAMVAAGVLVAGLLLPYVGGLGLAARHEATKFLDTTCNLTETPPPQKTTMYARDGKTVLATIFSQDRVPVPLASIPKALQDALVATEDRRFYQHHGVDMRGLIRSAISTSSGDTPCSHIKVVVVSPMTLPAPPAFAEATMAARKPTETRLL